MAVSYGLTKVEFGDIAVDGGMGTGTFTEVGQTVKGSFTMTSEEGTTTDFEIEEQDKPIMSIITPGATRITWETYDVGGAKMASLFGGSYDAGTRTYSAPEKVVAKEVSLKITSANGLVLNIVRVSLFPTFNMPFTSDALGKISLTAAVLAPEKADEPPYKIVYPA